MQNLLRGKSIRQEVKIEAETGIIIVLIPTDLQTDSFRIPKLVGLTYRFYTAMNGFVFDVETFCYEPRDCFALTA